MKKYNLFILGYGSSVTLEKWLHETHFPNTEIRILDNGGQTYTRLNPYLYYQTSQNLGCAGGWNLICNIAFNILKLDKVVISNEDNFYSEEYIEALYEQCTSTNISGTYDRAFEFSLFCIHKDTYNKIGMFDENINITDSKTYNSFNEKKSNPINKRLIRKVTQKRIHSFFIHKTINNHHYQCVESPA